MFAESPGFPQRRGTARIILKERGKLFLKISISLGRYEGLAKLDERRHQSFRHKSSAIWPPVAQLIRL
jgi:hypothetical protein